MNGLALILAFGGWYVAGASSTLAALLVRGFVMSSGRARAASQYADVERMIQEQLAQRGR